jgi:hypothetical membrane protein
MVLGSDNGKRAGALLFVGGAQFAVLIIVAEAVYPGYSVSANFISDLGVWGQSSAAFFNPFIIVFGLLVMTGAYFLQRTFRKRGLSVIVALSGLGALLVGFFPENTLVVSSVPVIHTIAALMSFIFGGLGAIISYRVTKAPLRYFSVVLGVASLLALVLFISTRDSGYLGLGVGGLERMIVYPTLIWTICFGGYLMASSEEK